MIQLSLTEFDEAIIRRVCELQLNSFEKILNSPKEESIREKLQEYQLSEGELNSMITGVASQYREIQLTPSSLFHTHSDLLSNFRDALDFNAESLTEFSEHLVSLNRKLDLAIFSFQNRN